MMPLAPADVLAIVLTCLVCAGGVAVVALLLLRELRERPLLAKLLVVTVSAILAMTLSVLAIALQMYLSEHDLTVLVWVVLIAGAFSALVAWALARSVRSAVGSLTSAVHRIGDGQPLAEPREGSDEFSGLSRELVDLSARIRAARDELEQLDSARRRFFAWISHDLRAPLAALRVIAESAQASGEESTRGLATAVEWQARSMARLVDDLFELSQLWNAEAAH